MNADKRALQKTTGSYYTPRSLIEGPGALLDTALHPLIVERMAADDPEQALLSLSVCDPSCGAAVFLVAAARRIAAYLATYRSGEDAPAERHLARARRDVIAGCIYGVDLNPLAVDLARLCLAAEALTAAGAANPDLSGRIKCGNALLGTTPALIAKGIPDAAYAPLPGDDPQVAAELRARNRRERQEQAAHLEPEAVP